MKIVQIRDRIVFYDMTAQFKDLADARAHFTAEIQIEEAPDEVFPGWTFDESKKGDARFVKPAVQSGQVYDDATGLIYDPVEIQSLERTRLHEATTNDTLQALRKIREGDTSKDWQAWLDALDAYNVAIEETKNQEGYPLRVEYPDYPTKP